MLTRTARRATAALAVATTTMAMGACKAEDIATNLRDEVKSAAASTSSPAPAGTALAAVDKLTVKGRAPKTGYEREQFGQAWTDDNTTPGGHNGCDSRNDTLQRDLQAITFKNSVKCAVKSGTLHDPYTGKTIQFMRGRDTSKLVQIDHLVALSDAWQKGAQNLTVEQRTNLANDPLNLLAVDGATNMSKSDGDAATWLPANKSFRCRYVSSQVAVKIKYNLWVTPAEQRAMRNVLTSCPAMKLTAEPGGAH